MMTILYYKLAKIVHQNITSGNRNRGTRKKRNRQLPELEIISAGQMTRFHVMVLRIEILEHDS